MTNKLPYLAQPGVVNKILDKIKEARTPDRFTYDFLGNTLGCKGGNYNQFVGFAKKIGFLKTDGTPTDLYKQFRNNPTSKAAMAEAIKKGYVEIFNRNVNADKLSRDDLKGLVIEITGLEKDSQVVQKICKTFENLKGYADFKKSMTTVKEDTSDTSGSKSEPLTPVEESQMNDLGVNLSYTINLVLPKTDDPAVFNAIFKSLRENLLRK
ncbi:MAG: hypothetical protein GF353_09530 [Candidatus Lokiarchaeota archaeon]|nr:hypothetical protein [Candidatus Lokiarchaeota archaeon]